MKHSVLVAVSILLLAACPELARAGDLKIQEMAIGEQPTNATAKIQVRHPNGSWKNVERDMTFRNGDDLRSTSDDASLTLYQGLRFKPTNRLLCKGRFRLTISEADGKKVVVKLDSGAVFPEGKGGNTEVVAGATRAAATATAYGVRILEGGAVELLVFEGTVKTAAGTEVAAGSKQRVGSAGAAQVVPTDERDIDWAADVQTCVDVATARRLGKTVDGRTRETLKGQYEAVYRAPDQPDPRVDLVWAKKDLGVVEGCAHQIEKAQVDRSANPELWAERTLAAANVAESLVTFPADLIRDFSLLKALPGVRARPRWSRKAESMHTGSLARKAGFERLRAGDCSAARAKLQEARTHEAEYDGQVSAATHGGLAMAHAKCGDAETARSMAKAAFRTFDDSAATLHAHEVQRVWELAMPNTDRRRPPVVPDRRWLERMEGLGMRAQARDGFTYRVWGLGPNTRDLFGWGYLEHKLGNDNVAGRILREAVILDQKTHAMLAEEVRRALAFLHSKP